MQHEDCAAVAEPACAALSAPLERRGVFRAVNARGCFRCCRTPDQRLFSKPLGGFVLAREVAGEAEILTVAVADKFARAGLGWRLMQSAIREAMMRGAETMFLEVDNNNASALGLYRKLGFKTVAERKAYYTAKDGTKSTALVMRRDLR